MEALFDLSCCVTNQGKYDRLGSQRLSSCMLCLKQPPPPVRIWGNSIPAVSCLPVTAGQEAQKSAPTYCASAFSKQPAQVTCSI